MSAQHSNSRKRLRVKSTTRSCRSSPRSLPRERNSTPPSKREGFRTPLSYLRGGRSSRLWETNMNTSQNHTLRLRMIVASPIRSFLRQGRKSTPWLVTWRLQIHRWSSMRETTRMRNRRMGGPRREEDHTDSRVLVTLHMLYQ